VHLIAAGKAARGMVAAFLRHYPGRVHRGMVVVATPLPAGDPAAARPEMDVTAGQFAWFAASHPVPDDASVAAGLEALRVAGGAAGEPLVVLLSGGASALLVAPAGGLALAAKQAVTSRLLRAGADIHELNTVRKHLSRVKGGRLAAAHAGPTRAFAISDVVGDDLSVIASGPTVGDPTRYADALAVLDRRGGREAYPPDAVSLLERGARGELPETPKPGDPALASAMTRVIGSSRDLLDAAGAAAARLGYRVVTLPEPVTGEARVAAAAVLPLMLARVKDAAAPAAVLSSGETTVHVTGRGIGGRNQEFALASVDAVAAAGTAALASVGSDGVDGPTEAAGAIVLSDTAARARGAGLDAARFLEENDSYRFFEALGDLVLTGPTGTNVGDFQVLLFHPPAAADRPAGAPSSG
jgi:glycerate 2-kinase